MLYSTDYPGTASRTLRWLYSALKLPSATLRERYMSFDKRLRRIELLEDEILLKASELMQDGRSAYYSDLFVLGATKRALSLASGFRTLMAARNFTCCAGLLRMQIDTAARLYALTLVDDMNALCAAVLSGARLDRQKDREGQLFKDRRLIAKLGEMFPWVPDVYRETSGFVHLSERHVFSSIMEADPANRTYRFSIGAEDPKRDDEAYVEILDAFSDATKMVGSLIVGYVTSKDLAEAGQDGTVNDQAAPDNPASGT